MNALYEGIALGLSLAFIFGFGPVFFAEIHTALHRGFWSGVLMAFGVFINDLIVVVLVLLGAVSVAGNLADYKFFGIIGGTLLIVFGIVTFRHKVVVQNVDDDKNNNGPRLLYFAKGFVLNLANPFVWLFWISVVVSATATYHADKYKLMLFFSGALGVVFLSDIFKVFTASRLKKFLTEKFLITINKIAGIALFGFGVFLIIRSLLTF
ncbi:MAG: LysE family transporter [Chlorobi bacterium]|nr:LysE family transporter [Chlorobiota bacterium]